MLARTEARGIITTAAVELAATTTIETTSDADETNFTEHDK